MSQKQDIHVGVVGAGVSGLVAIKECIAAGLKVTCFEKSSRFGGLWNYNDEIQTGLGNEEHFTPSVMKSTVLNTGKEFTAFSDFPPPTHLPYYMKHNIFMKYIRSYAEYFEVDTHIKLEHEVLSCKVEFNRETGTVLWTLLVLNRKTNEKVSYSYDKLLVAVGHHNIPFIPTFIGQDMFKGKIIHTVNIKNVLKDERFIDKKVIIIGFGNSACDVATDISVVAEKCYLSTPTSNWFMSRLLPTGPYDILINRWTSTLQRILPESMIGDLEQDYFNKYLDYQLLGLKPYHKPSTGIPNINDSIPVKILNGSIILKGGIGSFVEKGVIFEGEEDDVCDVDVVVLATGYDSKIDFLDELGLRNEKNEFELFLNIFTYRFSIPDLSEEELRKIIKSFGLIGYITLSGTVGSASELQARYAALVFKGDLDLPSKDEMINANELVKKKSRKFRYHYKDQLVLGDWIQYCDEIACRIGAKPDLVKLFFNDHALWKRLMFGPALPYHYRLTGPGKWDKARETIMKFDERLKAGINEGKNDILDRNRRKRAEKNRGKN